MIEELDSLTAAVVLIGLWMMGVTQLRTSLGLFGLQTVLLGCMAVQHGRSHAELALIVLGVAFALFKGIVVPLYLRYVIRRLGPPQDDPLMIAPPLLMFLTVGSLASLLLVRPFAEIIPSTALPAFGLLLMGMLLMLSRRLAIGQIIGFLVLENAIFMYTVSQPHAMPLVVELGVLLELMAWCMLAGLLVFQIKSSFEHIDVTRMKELRG